MTIESTFKNKTVLVVEDYELNQELMQLQLQEMGCKVLIANNGAEALEYCNKENVDFILMDINMPIMNGFDAAQKIRGSDQKYNNVPIVAMSANIDKEIMANCLSCGMNDVVVKPVGKKILNEILGRFFPDKSKEDEIEDIDLVSIEKDAGDSYGKNKEIYFDHEKALDEFCGNDMLLNNSIKSLVLTVDRQIDLIKKAILENDLETTKDQMHKISGAAANLTAVKLASLAGNVEKSAKDQTISADDLSRAFQEFEKFYIDFKKHVENNRIQP